jgi:catechol 2,3-dioxygenase-like lactoylglutathione lyase family enzyme
MKVEALVWLGVRTDKFEETVRLYRTVMGLRPYHEDAASARFRLENGTEIHVYGPKDEFHEFFGSAPVTGFLVDDVEQARTEMEAAGVEFIGEIQRDESSCWNHFTGPDGNIYEIISRRE